MVGSSLDAPVIDGEGGYVGRPGLSPVIAALVAAQMVHRDDRILDVGCGRGGDLLALADLGFRRLHGIDHNRRSVRAAKRRTGARGIDVRLAPITSLLDRPAQSYDWVFDTFLINNLREGEEPAYLAMLARLLPRGGGLVIQSKCSPRAPEMRGKGGESSPYFDLGPPVGTWFAEWWEEKRKGRWVRYPSSVPGYAQVGRRNGRRVADAPTAKRT